MGKLVRKKNNFILPATFISPSLIFFLIFLLFPIIFTILISFFQWNGYSKYVFANFIGISNYKDMFFDPLFWKSLINTIYYVIGVVVLQNIIALFLSIIIFLGKFKNSTLIRSIIFFPVLMSSVLVGLIWRRLFLDDGMINEFLRLIGLQSYNWFSAPVTPMLIIILASIWQGTGFNFVLFYAGLQSVRMELIEAAYIDGANFWQTIMKIIVPLLQPIIAINVILNVIGGFKLFDLVYVMTRGGPAHQTEVITSYIYHLSFSSVGPNKMGYAAAISMVLIIIVMAISAFRIRSMRG
ncbi:MAG: sugar ABC transporter permease [Actinobacteria bacterium]|nr:sugar ABC transporter permease [Actinomycetota bacterium]MCL5771409.1 sugar ABC transporter permease [Actinomycetota bacterium]